MGRISIPPCAIADGRNCHGFIPEGPDYAELTAIVPTRFWAIASIESLAATRSVVATFV
jgi:hypothetical protein